MRRMADPQRARSAAEGAKSRRLPHFFTLEGHLLRCGRNLFVNAIPIAPLRHKATADPSQAVGSSFVFATRRWRICPQNFLWTNPPVFCGGDGPADVLWRAHSLLRASHPAL